MPLSKANLLIPLVAVRDRIIGRVRRDGRSWAKRSAIGLTCTLLVVLVCAWTVPLPERLYSPPSTVLRTTDGQAAHVFLSPDDKWRIALDLNNVDTDYLRALIALEDERFGRHLGVDPIAIIRATIENGRAGGVVSGASTITMQLVRLLEPRPRTLKSKLLEAMRATQLELRMHKDEILAQYLSFVPFGRNVEGLEAASWLLFGHGPEVMTEAEIATLLAIPQAPNSRFPNAANQDRLKNARDQIATRLIEEGALGEPETSDFEILARVKKADVPAELHQVPQNLHHAARWIRAQTQKTNIETTIDAGVQATVDRSLRLERSRLARQGIHNTSVVVLNHHNGDIRALVGNFDFWDEDHGGQIIGFDTPRSPGSTLKPFLYARAIDTGRALPGYLVPDIPVAYGTYAPENYSGDFEGLATLDSALSRSLNVPFVNLLADIGVEPFIGMLKRAGVENLFETPGYYGLSAAIGGIELTPLEIAGLYGVIANNGEYQAPRWNTESPATSPHALLSPGAAWLTRQALAIRDRPDFPARRRLGRTPARIHWKTGTSYGHRDAWAVGSDADHTVAVWLGNFDNRPSPHLVGADAAGPILFDILEALSSPQPEPDDETDDLIDVEVCSLSGRLKSAACPHTKHVPALEQHVPTESCGLHVSAEVEQASGYRVTASCRVGSTDTRSFVVWPPAVRRWLAAHQRAQPRLPALAPQCDADQASTPPVIQEPASGTIAILLPGMAADEQEIPFSAESMLAETELSWFVNGDLIAQASADKRVWWSPTVGRHDIVVVDGTGSTGQRWLEVTSTE